MPITCRDVADDDATLELRCHQCERRTLIPGKLLVKTYGADTLVTSIVARMRCERDGMVPLAAVTLSKDAAQREANRRRLPRID